jgi:hypothetical protein
LISEVEQFADESVACAADALKRNALLGLWADEVFEVGLIGFIDVFAASLCLFEIERKL